MKKILSGIHRPARLAFVIGAAAVIIVLAVSTLLYIGAGRLFDYYSAVAVSEKLLAGVRPLSVGVCLGSLGLEYFSKQKSDD